MCRSLVRDSPSITDIPKQFDFQDESRSNTTCRRLSKPYDPGTGQHCVNIVGPEEGALELGAPKERPANTTYQFRGDLDHQKKNLFGFQAPESVFKLTFEERLLVSKGAERHYVRFSTCSDR